MPQEAPLTGELRMNTTKQLGRGYVLTFMVTCVSPSYRASTESGNAENQAQDEGRGSRQARHERLGELPPMPPSPSNSLAGLVMLVMSSRKS